MSDSYPNNIQKDKHMQRPTEEDMTIALNDVSEEDELSDLFASVRAEDLPDEGPYSSDEMYDT